MKLEEAVEHLELFKDDLNELKPNEDFILQDGMKFDTVEALQRVLHYIKEESISKTVVEEKIKQLKEQSGGNVFHIQQTINSNIRLLQEILNKGD